ncbi:MAG: molecular chaperone HtpG [Rectinemataceae bacterium]
MSQHHFKTEVSRLLDLIIHSLYSHKEIFLRELISNASDAIDKLRYLTVSDEAYKSLSFDPLIAVSIDKDAKTLTITDNGIGMDAKELEENLGTIARSGTRTFMENMSAEARRDSNLIGQFGVGFYSAFMVASRVEVTSRKAGADAAFRWKSAGKGEYSVDPAEKASHGTEVKLFLNDEGEEYLSRWKVEDILKKYSNHVAYPIHLVSMESEYDDKGKENGKKEKDEQINSASALWRKPKSSLKDEDYIEFYKALSGSDEPPLHWLHTKAEGTVEYDTLFYIPEKAPFDMYRADYRPGVKLYVRRVFITDDDKELLPTYLRFVRGVIDSEDLPLNVSREILQQNRVMQNIRQASVKKILGELADIAKNDATKFGKFVDQFNRPLKEGLYSDFANREALLGLVRWKSTAVEGWTSFADYKTRAGSDRKAIYYLAGNDESRLRRSPLLEAYRKKGIEVLVCADEIDEIVLSSLGEVEGLELKSINRSGSEDEIGKSDEPESRADEKTAEKAVEAAKRILGDAVKDVRLSKRLAESPSCVVVDSDDPSFQLSEMMRQMGGTELPDVKPILELNPSHELVKRLAAIATAAPVSAGAAGDADEADDLARLLLDQALLLEGAQLKDPASFVARMNRRLVHG